MKRLIMLLVLALAFGAGFLWYGQSSPSSEPQAFAPDARYGESSDSTPVQVLKDRVMAFGKACAKWGVGSRQAYSHATELAKADFASTPLTDVEIREIKTEFAETMIAKGETEEAISVLNEIVEQDRVERNSIETTGAVLRLGQQFEMRQAHAARHQQLGVLLLETGQYNDAMQNFDDEVALLERSYGTNYPGLVFALQDKIYSAEQARVQGEAIGSLQCEKQRLRIMQENALRLDFADQEDIDEISPEPVDLTSPDTCPELPVFSPMQDYETVRVFYGTNRKANNPNKSSKPYGARMGKLSVGTLKMTVEPDDLVGAYSPKGKLNITGEETYTVFKKSAQSLSKDQFTSELARSMAQSDGHKKEAFIYIHGHNVQFQSAARRAAQLALSLDMRDGAIVYSWPSGQRMTLYAKSQINAQRSAKYLTEFLRLVRSVEDIDELHVIAHSMGNDVLTRALNKLELEGYTAEQRPFGQIIWASPDVASEDFANYTTAYKTRKIADGMTLYASSKDRALCISNWLSDMKRAGQSPPLPDVAGVVPTVDTTNAYRESTDLIAHTDYADGAIDDIKALFWFNLNPDKRCFLGSREVENIAYWSAGRGTCSEEAFRSALSIIRARNYAALDSEYNFRHKIEEIRMHVDPVDWAAAEILAENLSDKIQ